MAEGTAWSKLWWHSSESCGLQVWSTTTWACATLWFQPSCRWVIASDKCLFPCRAVRHVHVQKEPPGAGLPNPQRSHDLQLLDKPVLDHRQPQGTRHPLRPVHEAHGEKAQVRNGALSLCTPATPVESRTCTCDENWSPWASSCLYLLRKTRGCS